MRRFLLILTTMVVIGAALFVYTWFQPPVPKKPKGTIGALNKHRPELSQALRGLAKANAPGPSVMTLKTGELASQFTSLTYKPKKDGTVDVDKPEAEFFSSDGKQRIHIQGITGNVLMSLGPEDKSNSNQFQSQSGATMPSRGKLHDVVISVFEPVDADKPMLTATMNNAAFDTDTFRVNTEAYTDASGANVPADRVPVQVRGRDYDFDGKGLVVRWNERDRKLQLLEVEHGDSLVIKNPPALSVPQAGATNSSSLRLPIDPTGGMLASADPTAHRLILTATKTKHKTAKRPAAASKKHHPAPASEPAGGPTTRKSGMRDLSPVVYRANFEQDVRIFQGDDLVATGDHLHVDWLQEQTHGAATKPVGNAGQHAATAPSTQDSGQQSNHASINASSQPATHPTGSRRHASSSSPNGQGAATEPTTKPVTVKWTGKLRVVPLDNAPVAEMVPGKAIAHLIGAPATLIRETMHAQCGEAVFDSADSSASLLPSAAVPQVTMTGDHGLNVVTPRLQYTQPAVGPHVATLIGASTADLPVEGNDAAHRDIMKTSWSKLCTLKMTGEGDHAVLQEADLEGDVKVAHPKMGLTADALALFFDPAPPTIRRASTQSSTQASSQPTTSATTLAATRPAHATTAPSEMVAATLREILATGNAHCTMIDEQNPRAMNADRLHINLARSADGQMYPKIIDADGNAHIEETSYAMVNDETIENVRSLDSGHLTAHLAPSTRPSTKQPSTQSGVAADAAVGTPATMASTQKTRSSSQPFGGGNLELLSLLATDNVKLTAPDDTVATADTLQADRINDQLRYTLIGKPTASISSNKGGKGTTTISGPRIVFDPDRNTAQVIGGGTALGTEPDKPLQTMHLEWAGDANINGNTNLIDVDRDVVIHSIEADGTANRATAHHLQATLTTKPTTQSTTQESASKPADAPASGDLQTSTFLKDKEISAATLMGDVRLTSELLEKDGSMARGMLLKAERATFDQLAGRMEVPVPGELLYQDHRTPATQTATTQPSTTQASSSQPTTSPLAKVSHRKGASRPATAESGGSSESRGRTAFKWQKSLVYERALQRATMTGDVLVVHQTDDPSGMPFKLTGQTLTATFERKQPTSGPTTAATKAPASSDPTGEMGKLRQIDVTGGVHVTSARADVEADELTFNPITQELTAHGDPRHPVTVFDHEHGSVQTMTDLYWNMATDTIKTTGATGRIQN